MNLIIRKASVLWTGGAKGGTRAVAADGGMLKQAKSSINVPLQNDSQTDPAELIAAAHANSFSLALSHELKLKPFSTGSITTIATVTLERRAARWTIMNIHLSVLARIPKMSQRRFIDATVRAKTNCLVSHLPRTTISMSAKLESKAPAAKKAPSISQTRITPKAPRSDRRVIRKLKPAG
jgi:osmotically inducible protein OsmC